ncbi:MAG: lipoprotein [Ferruginibacter sp.]
MKRILYLITLIIVLTACSSSKNYLERSDEDKALVDAVKKLNKSASDENATAALPILYNNIKLAHLAKIKSYNNSRDISRWDKIVAEFNALQTAHDAIINSTAAFKLVSPENYGTQLLEAKQGAAEEYYSSGLTYLAKTGRDNAKKAYTQFKKADKFIPGFKDAQAKTNEAYEKAIVNVVINPVQDNSFFFNSSWGNYGYNYSNEYFQQTLIRDLDNSNSSNRYAARFYTEWEARRDNVKPDWVIDLTLRNMNIPPAGSYRYNQNRSARIQVGTDTAGRPQYRTVTATLYVTRQSFDANADMEVRIKELESNKNISYRSFRESYRWEEENATYSGDSRALNSYDWQLINSNGYNQPRKEDVLNELYRKIYPQVLNNIRFSVDW